MTVFHGVLLGVTKDIKEVSILASLQQAIVVHVSEVESLWQILLACFKAVNLANQVDCGLSVGSSH